MVGAAKNTKWSNASPASAAASTPIDGMPTAATHPSWGTTPAASVMAPRSAVASKVALAAMTATEVPGRSPCGNTSANAPRTGRGR